MTDADKFVTWLEKMLPKRIEQLQNETPSGVDYDKGITSGIIIGYRMVLEDIQTFLAGGR